jgi:putative ABC transport system permease protein
MFKNNFKVAIRNLIRNKTYSFISILGLAVGLAVCIMLSMYVQYELSYDRFHKNADHIYRLCRPDHPYQSPQTAKLLADNLPEIEEYVRLFPLDCEMMQYREKRLKKELVYADASLFRIFSFKFKYGNPATALREPFTMVISEKVSHHFFGNENPVGKILIKDSNNYRITGVTEELPYNSHFRYDVIATLTNSAELFGESWMHNWEWLNFLVYFKMRDGFSQPAFEKKCQQIITAHRNGDSNSSISIFSLQRLKDIHLHSSHFINDIQPQNSITNVLLFSSIGILILLIACFNYINLLTANAITRANEIGVRKVVGASRNQLAMQFIGESIIVLSIALIFSLLMIHLFLPVFNALSGKVLSFGMLTNTRTILGIIGILLVTGLFAGCYPAFVLSGYHPVRALKASISIGHSGFQIRRWLVGAQFTIVIMLLCCAFLMLRQIRYLENKELGFDKAYILHTELDISGNAEKYNALKHVLLQLNFVNRVTSASRVPSDDLNNVGRLMPEGGSDKIAIPFVHTDFDYFKTFGITAKAGRLFSKNLQTDRENAIILNETAVKTLGLQGNPVGQMVQYSWFTNCKKEVIGVVDDFHFESLYKAISPIAFTVDYNEIARLAVRIHSPDPARAVKTITEICNTFYPEQIFEFQFLDQRLEEIYRMDKCKFQLMGYATVLAIFIACIGLFGVACFMIQRRTKEIGVRKVLGASIPSIIHALTRDFTAWILLSNIIALPVSWYVMSKWLQNFAYHIDLHWWMFALAGLLVLIIAQLTVSWQAVRAATANPVKSLRYE